MLKEESETFERINKTNEMQKKIFSDFEKILRDNGNINNIYDNYYNNDNNENDKYLNNDDNIQNEEKEENNNNGNYE